MSFSRLLHCFDQSNAFILLRQNAPRLAVGMNGEENPPKLQRRRAKDYGEFRHPFLGTLL
jgi:hypothetical protein